MGLFFDAYQSDRLPFNWARNFRYQRRLDPSEVVLVGCLVLWTFDVRNFLSSKSIIAALELHSFLGGRIDYPDSYVGECLRSEKCSCRRFV